MTTDSRIINVFQKINFLNRYSELFNETEFKDRLKKVDKTEVLNLFKKLGIDNVKYKSGENFYQIKEQSDMLEFYFHISIKGGIYELIFGVFQLSPKQHLAGGSAGSIYDEIVRFEKLDVERVKTPIFSTKEQLKEMLDKSLSIYEDFKTEFISEFETTL